MNALEQLIREQEETLLVLQVRKDAEQMKSLLAEDFTEIGTSGRLYTRADVLEHVAEDEPRIAWKLSHFNIRQIAPDVVLATYQTRKEFIDTFEIQLAQRSSIWKKCHDVWKMFFHQSTAIGG